MLSVCVCERKIKCENGNNCACKNEKRELFKRIHICRENERERKRENDISYEKECARACDFFLGRSPRWPLP